MWVSRDFTRINERFTSEKQVAVDFFGQNGATQRLGRASMLRGLSSGQYARLKKENAVLAMDPIASIIEALRGELSYE